MIYVERLYENKVNTPPRPTPPPKKKKKIV